MGCCVDCFRDRNIRNFIESIGEDDDCEFCEATDVPVAEPRDVGEFIEQGLRKIYEDPANSVSYCSAEGGYQYFGVQPTDYHEAVSEMEIFSERLDDPTALLDALDLDQDDVIRKDPYGPLPDGREQVWTWETFKKDIRTKYRYTILMNPEFEGFFEQLRRAIAGRLVTTLQPGTILYRARRRSCDFPLDNESLTAPPASKARAGRMNPAGISMFYGAFDKETAIQEVRPSLADEVAAATFETVRPLTILDLTSIPEASPFSDDYDFVYDQFDRPFLLYFARDISKPVRPEDAEGDYLATQALVELLKAKGVPGIPRLHGIRYRSSLREGGEAILLFAGPEISRAGAKEREEEPWLRFLGGTWVLVESIKVETRPLPAAIIGRNWATPPA